MATARCGGYGWRWGAKLGAAVILMTGVLMTAVGARASTYVVYIPVDDPIYDELDTLNGLGLLESYLPEIKPISRVEAARLTIEARDNLAQSSTPQPLAENNIDVLSAQLAPEIGWLENNEEDRLPTMVRPIQRLEAQYVYSSGQRRQINVITASHLTVQEATPLLSNNSDLPTDNGNNGEAIWEGWAGVGGFLSAYGQGAFGGPLRDDHNAPDRDRIVDGAAVLDLGNVALSFGNEQMQWGVGHFSQLTYSTNASAFAALRVQNVHPSHLPGFLRYLGPMRWQVFFGQLDSNRTYSRPWIDGEILAFKPLPSFEFGFTHSVLFGGNGNDFYNWSGFLGRATGVATGNRLQGNTHTVVSAFASMRLQRLRGSQLYAEIRGEDFYQPGGHNSGIKLPFKGPSYQLGVYLPRLTRDGLTDARLEWTLLDKEYSMHDDSLYWAYDGRVMGDPLGSHGQRIALAFGRWLDLRYKLGLEAYYELRRPQKGAPGNNNENGTGLGFDFLQLPLKISRLDGALADFKARTDVEYVNNINYGNRGSLRAMVMLSIGMTSRDGLIEWRR